MFERLGITFHVTPNFRYFASVVIANICWWGAFILTILRVMELIGPSVGVIIVLMIGVGICSGLSLSRQRLEKIILEAFRAGYKTMELDNRRRETELRETRENLSRVNDK